LLVISQVFAVDVQDRGDLDYRANPDYPDPDWFEVGCGFKGLVSERSYQELIQTQQKAEIGECKWCFDDPKRVALEALARLLQIKDSSIAGLETINTAQGRVNYQWMPEGRAERYMIVVSKPYLLSFYAKDPSHIAWVPIAVWESSCEKRNSATRGQ
jgi:hypothetical protein